jgi:hypothetical protein
MSKLREEFEAWWRGLPPEAKYCFDSEGRGYKRGADEMAALAWQAAYKAGMERGAVICDEKAKKDFNWASENADRYHVQADWAAVCAAAIRKEAKDE